MGDYSVLKDEIIHIKGLEGEITYHLCLSPEYFVSVAKGLASV